MQEVMDAMVSRKRTVGGVPTSLYDLGYTDVGLDDGWQLPHAGGHGYHNASGFPIVNTTKFPNLRAMTDYGHARNLTVGFYGNNCWAAEVSPSPAPLDYYLGDVASFHAWNFDSYKLDDCGTEKNMQLWADLLPNKTLENCKNVPWFPEPPYKPNGPGWCPMHFFRVSVDAEVLYAAVMGINLQLLEPWGALDLSYPGCWAYGDMLEVGVTPGLHPREVALTHAEARAHFASMAVLSSPLVLGLDVRDDAAMDSVWDIISNTELLAINSAWAGSAGVRVARSSTNVTWAYCGQEYFNGCSAPAWEAYAKPLSGGGVAVLVLNHADGSAPVNVTLPLATLPGLACSTCRVRDVYAHADAGTATGSLAVTNLPTHDSYCVTLMPA